ncbi:MAG: DNA ligase D [Ginsengibacter sp.]
MALTLYNKKRNFDETSEPSGKLKKSASKLEFVVQRHKASRLHYDFRLEMNGVLKSWAVPKGPSLNPRDKRLAMMVEDHPYDYKNFKGVIPEGNYGAGIVEIWDSGTYADLENSPKETAEKKLKAGLKAGNLKVQLFGKKLKGEFALVKLKGKEDNSWLLIKHNDTYAVDADYNSEEVTPWNSPINKWLAENQVKKPSKKKLIPVPTQNLDRKLERFIKPMLASETEEAFDDDEWLFEIKWDGYRAICEKNKNGILLYSRNGLNFLPKYPVVADQLRNIREDVIIDGEIVVVNDEGQPEFQLLQHYSENKDRPIRYYIFDLLKLNKHDTTGLSLLERKELLQKIIPENEVIKYADHILEHGKSFFKVSEEKNLEGILAKKTTSKYYPGRRTPDWLKIKHHKTQEAIIAGYTEPAGGRKYFGALILAIKNGKELKYIGHTGTGFNYSSLKEMYETLQPLVQEKSPFGEKIKTNMPVTWVKPELICEVKYSEITADGKLRHPVYLHLREDKNVDEVKMTNNKPVKLKVKKDTPGKIVEKNIPTETEKTFTFGKSKVNVTNLNKVFFPGDGVTKGDVINYYISMSRYILPYLEGRPESLLRNPNGIHSKGFFQKDAAGAAPAFVKHQKVFSESTKKQIDYIVCDNEATLTYLNNLGCIEFNPWHSTVEDLNMPDYLIIDIDPSEKNTFQQVIEVANVVKQVLDKAGAISYCKTSGASGIHVYVPTAKKYTYDQVKDFAYIISILASDELKGFTTLERNLQKRGHSHIYMDYLQNRKGQTISAVYSLRPKDGATVSTPLLWKEVKTGLTPRDFTIHNIEARIKKTGDIFKGVLGKGIDLQKCLKKLGA